MGKFVFVLNTAGVRELLQSEEMQAVLLEYADSVAREYGPDAETGAYVGKNRANASVFQRKGDYTNDLLKAVGKAGENG